MRVLVIPSWYPSGEDKLMGLYHKEFTGALNRYGIEANMLYIDRQRLSQPMKYLFMKKREVDIEKNYKVFKYRMLNLGPISFDLQVKSYTKKLEKAFKNYLKTNPKPDVLHAQVTVPAGYAACVLGKKYGIPVVVTEHGGNLERFFSKEQFKHYTEFVMDNCLYTTVSDYMKKIVLNYYPECDVIPNQVNVELFKNDVKRKIEGTFKLVTVCALREGKRLDIAFRALKQLVREEMDVHLDIIGDGFFEEIYKEKMREEGVQDYVTFLGRKSKEEIAEYLINEHALLISSELESFAIPGVEALASGMPVISTDCLGPSEFVDEKCGCLCKVNDPDDMVRAIKTVYEKYDEYDRKYLEGVADKFSEENVIKKAREIYERAQKLDE